MWMFDFDDDITWCSSECDYTVCFRHPENRRKPKEGEINVFTCALLKDTEYCPLWKGEEK